MEFIDLKSQQSRIRSELEAAIAEVLEHGRYIMGPEVNELEEKLADYVGVKHCVSASSGTDTLLIALMALGVGPGDEVITVPYTWISSAEVIALAGATPVFVDVDESTWNLNPELLEAAITEKTKAIIPVGIFGLPADLQAIHEIAQRHDLPVIEDAAQCFGGTQNQRKSCGLSTVGSTSFFPTKPLGCYGDGGALFTDDDELAKKMAQIRVHGQEKKHHHPILGFNARLDTLQAAILLQKLPIFDSEIKRRQEVAERYLQALSSGGLEVTTQKTPADRSSAWAQFTILSPERDDLAQRLKQKGIPSVSYYQTPLHLQLVFSNLGYQEGAFPMSEKISSQSLSLPMNPYLSEEDIERVCQSLKQ